MSTHPDKLDGNKLKPFDGVSGKKPSTGPASVGRLSRNAWPFTDSEKSERSYQEPRSVQEKRRPKVNSELSQPTKVEEKPKQESRKLSKHEPVQRKPSVTGVQEKSVQETRRSSVKAEVADIQQKTVPDTRRSSIKSEVTENQKSVADTRRSSVKAEITERKQSVDASSVSLERRNSKRLPNDCWPPKTNKRGSIAKEEPIVLPGRRGSTPKLASPRTPTKVSRT